MSGFKRYEIGAVPVCKSCNNVELNNLIKTDYPKGSGRFKGTCPKCDMSTWFDYYNDKEELINSL